MAPKQTTSSSGTDTKLSVSKTITKKHDKSNKEPNLVKRNKSPGVRVIHGKIYDSLNGKCCHQCRQKTLKFSVRCKNQTEDKQCTCYFCHSCLLNRYGEKAAEMAALDDWKCPKCREICNCSICRKKQGCSPIGRIRKLSALKPKTTKPQASIINKTNKETETKKHSQKNKAQLEPNPTKRNKSPGVRVINGKIYDSQNGKCCHQCRQKTLNFSVKCNNQTGDKQCSFYFCHICLSNRYGEKAEEMVALGDWKCPKCRGICNCSICRKKQGCYPVGRISKHFASKTKTPKPNTNKINKANMKAELKKQSKSNKAQEEQNSAKRKKSPGVRVIHGRIYDSQNGKCCHQCRQKTLDFSVKCKSQTEDTKCSFYFCHKCLLIRYGEKAEEMAALGDWKCPKCRGICNCSICRKKQGCCPTGRIMKAAKAGGFASVSEMLQSKPYEKDMNGSTGKSSLKSKCKSKGYDEKDGILGTERITNNNSCKKDARTISKGANGSLKDLFSSKKDLAIASLRRWKNGSILVGENGRKLNFEVVKLVKKIGNCESRNDDDGRGNLSEGYILNEKPIKKEDACIEQSGVKSRKRKVNMTGPNEERKRRITIENDAMLNIISSEDDIEERPSGIEDGGQSESKILDMEDPEENCNVENKEEINNLVAIVLEDDGKQVDKFAKHQYNTREVQSGDYYVETAMPQGIELTKVAEIDFAAEDVGHALQFLEFSEAFGKVLDITKGQPECLLRELASRQCSYRVGDLSIVGFHIKLLSLIQNNFGEQNYSLDSGCADSWLQALSRYIADSRYQPKELLLDQIDLICKSYGELSSSKKLRLLTYLCDEALGSVELRNWMDMKILECDEEERKGKENERKKEKEVKSKLQNELARAVLANNGAPLSVSEHQDLVSNIKAKVAHTLAELVIKKNQKSDAIRSEPMFLDGNGCKFWKLRGHSNENTILLQDISSDESVIPRERWFSYNMEEGDKIEKFISRQLRK